ncbi:MAG: hypothetical protein LBE07_08590 [Gordonia sp. (in: high G+C Gram-positive bacteria)]|nr:hypothetical protein [Gordonia sp. (in: high G+C Gram-positive bacteria)]
MTKRNILFAALGMLVVSLLFGSLSTTFALWSDQQSSDATDVATGTIELSPGDGTGSAFAFPALNGTNVPVGGVSQANLTIKNTGTTPLRFRLRTAGPTVSTSGATVGVTLDGSVGACPGGPAAFTSQTVTSPTVFTSPWAGVVRGGQTVWCIRATLASATGTLPATYTISFAFDAEQTRP